MGAGGQFTAFGDIYPAGEAHLPNLEVHPPQPKTVVVPNPRPGSPWLEFVKPSTVLQDTDLVSKEWVGEPFKCRSNVTSPDKPWWHPAFTFKTPVHAVRVRLRGLRGPAAGRELWDVIFAGRPGSDYSVPNEAPPAGGKLPLFPEFCPPLSSDSVFELRLTHKAARPQFDERLLLRPKRSLPHGEPPAGAVRPAYHGGRPGGGDGALPVDDGAPFENLDPETGERTVTAEGFL